jgi:hypothetical protein
VTEGISIVTPAEGLVLMAATILVGVVFVESAKSSLTSRVGVLLLTVAMLGVVAALLHMFA